MIWKRPISCAQHGRVTFMWNLATGRMWVDSVSWIQLNRARTAQALGAEPCACTEHFDAVRKGNTSTANSLTATLGRFNEFRTLRRRRRVAGKLGDLVDRPTLTRASVDTVRDALVASLADCGMVATKRDGSRLAVHAKHDSADYSVTCVLHLPTAKDVAVTFRGVVSPWGDGTDALTLLFPVPYSDFWLFYLTDAIKALALFRDRQATANRTLWQQRLAVVASRSCYSLVRCDGTVGTFRVDDVTPEQMAFLLARTEQTVAMIHQLNTRRKISV